MIQHNKDHRELKFNQIVRNSKLLITSNIKPQLQEQVKEINKTLDLKNTKPISIYIYTESLKAKNDIEYTCNTTGSFINGGTYQCKTNDVLTEEQYNFIVNIMMKRAIEILSQTLQVPERLGPISVGGNVCQSSTTGPITGYPSNLTNPGVDADLVLFLTARPIQSNGSVLAFGYDCEFDSNLRTIIGQLNFNPSSISIEEKDYNFQLGVALHETSHVLGFSKDRFIKKGLIKQFSKSNTTSNSQDIIANMIVSPNVKSFVRSHFNCQYLQGAELEDQGGSGTADSHWEKRIFNNEYMTGTASHTPIFSNLTLSLFSDLGFYSVNFTYAQQLVWGYGLGCDFTNKPCNEWGNSKLFCSSVGSRPICSYDRTSKGQCSLTSQRVPPYYSYFNYDIGGDALADYCPSVEGYANMYCETATNVGDLNGEYFGSSSLCFDSSLVRGKADYLTVNAKCYPTACLGNNKLKIKINNYYYNCDYGSSISIFGFSGSITCPSLNENSVCVNAPIDNTWPSLISIEPKIVSPGDQILIYGNNILNSTILINGIPLINVTFIGGGSGKGNNSNILKGYLNLNGYTNPDKLKLLSASIIIYLNDNPEKSDVTMGLLNLSVPYDNDNKIKKWFRQHWWIVLIVGIAILIFFTILIIRCCFFKKIQDKKDGQKMKQYPLSNL